MPGAVGLRPMPIRLSPRPIFIRSINFAPGSSHSNARICLGLRSRRPSCLFSTSQPHRGD